ncbi:MAG: hypothetical protein ACJ779_04680 [Chloroflexota bacterium]
MDESPRWEIEDLTDVHDRIGPDRTALWFGVAVAVIAAVIGFGFVGRVTTPETPVRAEAAIATARPPVVPSDPAAALRISSPVAGALVDAAVITVTGDARQPIGLTHFAVHLGDAVLGWSNVDISAAGAFSVTIRVFAPPFDVPADLRIDAAAAVDRAAIALTVPIVLRSGDGIWSARRSSRSVRPAIEVEGVGPLVDGHVQIRVETREGTVLTRTWATFRTVDGLAGSAGGRMLGVGSFTATLPLGRGADAADLVVWVGPHRTVLADPTKPRASDGRR